MMHEALMDEVVVTKRCVQSPLLFGPLSIRDSNKLILVLGLSACFFGYRDIYYKDPKLFGSQGVVDRVSSTRLFPFLSTFHSVIPFLRYPTDSSFSSPLLKLRSSKLSLPLLDSEDRISTSFVQAFSCLLSSSRRATSYLPPQQDHSKARVLTPSSTETDIYFLPRLFLPASFAQRALVFQTRRNRPCRLQRQPSGRVPNGRGGRGGSGSVEMWGYAGTSKSLVLLSCPLGAELCSFVASSIAFPQPTLIPPSESIEDVRLIDGEKELLWILIIEKDAIFQTLCSIKFGAEEGLLITVR